MLPSDYYTLPRPLPNTPKACMYKERIKLLLSILQLAA